MESGGPRADDVNTSETTSSHDADRSRFRVRLNWRRWALGVVAILVSTSAGAAVGLVVFGFPPVYLAPEGDDRADCSVIRERAGHALAEDLQPLLDGVFPVAWDEAGGQGDAATPQLIGVRCGDGMRAWGTPVRAGERATWLDALSTSVATLGFEVAGATPLDLDPEALRHETTDNINGRSGHSNAANAQPANEDQPLSALSLEELAEARATAQQDLDRAIERLRRATSPERLEELLEGDPDDVVQTRRALLAAYSGLQNAQERLRAIESAIARAPAPEDEDEETDDDAPEPVEPPTNGTDDTDPEAEAVPESFEPPTRLAVIVPSPVLPLTMGGVLGLLSSIILLAMIVLLRAQLAMPSARPEQRTGPADR